MKNKILSLDSACTAIEKHKNKNRKIVLCYGLFHFLHIGHIRYLKQAKDHGDILIVSIRADKYIEEKENVQFDEHLRAEALASLDYVDMVVVNPFESIYKFARQIKPDIYFKGFESKKNGEGVTNKSAQEAEPFEDIGVEIVMMQENVFSSTRQINQYLAGLPEEIQKYLYFFKQRYPIESLLGTIEKMKDIKVLIVGDTILDEYQYCSAIGKSSKDPTLALKYTSHDLFAGGVLAVANHVAGFADHVDLITVIGESDSYKSFIQSNLQDNIKPEFFFKPNAPTTLKRRFIDGYSTNKLLEVYVMDDSDITGEFEEKFHQLITDRLQNYDLIMAADFGHGTINTALKKLLAQNAPFLSLNAQSNAGNRGFNNITQYPRADYVSMAEHEIRLEMRNVNGKIRPMMAELAKKMSSCRFTVTQGRSGCMVIDNNDNFSQIPSFAQRVVDRVGAGDALFSITSLAAVQKAPCELIGFLGNATASLAVEVMGNQKAINNEAVLAYIDNLYT